MLLSTQFIASFRFSCFSLRSRRLCGADQSYFSTLAGSGESRDFQPAVIRDSRSAPTFDSPRFAPVAIRMRSRNTGSLRPERRGSPLTPRPRLDPIFPIFCRLADFTPNSCRCNMTVTIPKQNKTALKISAAGFSALLVIFYARLPKQKASARDDACASGGFMGAPGSWSLGQSGAVELNGAGVVWSV